MSSTGHGVGGDGKPQHGIGVGVGLDDARRIGVVGKLVAHAPDRVAHVGCRDVEIDAVGELDGDAASPVGGARRDRLDARDARHRALDHRGQFAVDGFGGRAAIVGGDGDDRPVDVGQFANFHAEEGGQPGDHDQRVDDEGQDRPAHEQRGHAVVGAGIVGWRHRVICRPCSGAAAGGGRRTSRRLHGWRAGLVVGDRATSAPSRTTWTPSVTTTIAFADIGRDEHAFRVALDDADQGPLGLAVAHHPDERAVRAPLDGQRVDRRIGVAGEFHRHPKRHAGAQRILGVVDPGPDAKRAALLVKPVVDCAYRAFEGLGWVVRSALPSADRRP